MPSALISIVVPTYNVATYLPAFLDSLARQTLPLTELEMIFVNDGSTDRSEELIRTWCAAHAPHATVISKPNGGLASARNAGLDVATGTWINFCDPDDEFNDSYFATVRDFLTSDEASRVQLVATNLRILDDTTGKVEDTHPLRFKFQQGRQIVDLSVRPEFIHLQAASSFQRRAVLLEQGLRFDDDIKPNFEDAYLITLYLAGFEHPTIAVLPEAHYRYRRRADGTSLVQSSWAKPEKYTLLPRIGYLRLLETIHARRGFVPPWAQNLILYDIFFYFRADARIHSETAALPSAVTDVFHRTLEQIANYLDTEVIEAYRVAWASTEMRMAVLYGAKHGRTAPSEATIDRHDPDQRLIRLRYFTGEPTLPDETIRSAGEPVTPVHAKLRAVRFLGQTMVYERIAWLPDRGAVSLEVDGTAMAITTPASLTRFAAPTTARATKAPAPRPAGPAGPLAKAASRLRRLPSLTRRAVTRLRADPGLARVRADDVRIRAMVRRPDVQQRFARAWLLLDRDSQAQDNAEHLYRHLRDTAPEVNTWFVLSRASNDWARLEREGFRLLAHGSREYYAAVLLAEHMVSSQIDHYVVAPTYRRRLPKPRFRYTFLQHGVTKDDLSRWINFKPIDVMITVTPDEHESIVADGTPYVFTTREIKMTGFPRHDRLRALAARADSRDLLLVMPTWRRELLGDTTAGGNDRELVADFWSSEYAVRWRSLLESPVLREIADRAGWRITFVPHPNMQDYLDTSPLADHIDVHRFRDIDVQDVLARGAMMVTDYSSLAFEMAYIDRPVVYFQFDQDSFFSGAHAYRKGTWSYPDNGFGPITVELEDALSAIAAVAGRSGAVAEPYAARIAATFPLRDGQCCARTVTAIRALRRPATEPSADAAPPVT